MSTRASDETKVTTRRRDLELTTPDRPPARPSSSSVRPPYARSLTRSLASAPVSRGFLRFSRGRASRTRFPAALLRHDGSALSVLRPARPNDAPLRLTKRLIRARCRNPSPPQLTPRRTVPGFITPPLNNARLREKETGRKEEGEDEAGNIASD